MLRPIWTPLGLIALIKFRWAYKGEEPYKIRRICPKCGYAEYRTKTKSRVKKRKRKKKKSKK